MDAFRAWLAQLQFDGVWQTAVLVAASLLCITFHETCHGLAAYRLGDNTAKRMGRLSLNPLKHVDLMGLIMMALFRFGWAKPVPVDMRNFKNPKAGIALTALAGTGFECAACLCGGGAVQFCDFSCWTISAAAGCFWRWRSSLCMSRSSARVLPFLTCFRSRRSTARRFCSRCFPTGRMTDSCGTKNTAWGF